MSKEVYKGTYKCVGQILIASLGGISNAIPNGINIDFIKVDFTNKNKLSKRG